MKYSEDIKMEIAGKFINGTYTDNLKLIYKDLNRLTKSAISEQLTLTDVSQQRELLIAFSECVVKDVTIKGHEEVVDYFLKKHKAINCG
jgi:hypothetical protein